MPAPAHPVSESHPSGLVVFEDEDLLVVDKPAGLNTHAPSPFAGEGIYDWLRHRERRWANLAILHRLDKETSGLMVFGKTTRANRSLTEQFTGGSIEKRYVFLTDRPVPQKPLVAVSTLVRAGEKYLSRPMHPGHDRAETRFRILSEQDGKTLVEAEPVTGRTHQIRVHAAEHGFPILGDRLYGGSDGARVFLHAQQLKFEHPATKESLVLESKPPFGEDHRRRMREALIDSEQTNAFRVVHGASDGWPGLYVERLGDYLLAQSAGELTGHQTELLLTFDGIRGVYHKRIQNELRQSEDSLSPRLILGESAPEYFEIRENGVRFRLSFQQGYSVGLFLDQRDNRRRFLKNHVAAGFSLLWSEASGREVLNTFAYTCGFSVCAALAGARVTSLDLSKRYLEWGKNNFVSNGLDPATHDFIFGDTFDWLRRMQKRGRTFDVIILDPPTFSQSKAHGVFRAVKDYGRLVSAALPVLKSKGVLLSSTNAAGLEPADFVDAVLAACKKGGRPVIQQHYVPQPPDFPITRAEPGYLKTLWLRVG